MIYVNNNYYEIIFIAGGKDTKSFYFDIKNNEFINWRNTNYCMLDLPSFLLMIIFIFIFLITPKNKIIFERTNINDSKKK